MNNLYTGSCLCGAVKFQVSCAIDEIECCHCSICKKAHASAFSLGVTIPAQCLKIVTGKEMLMEYESTKGKFRVFCRTCGTAIYACKPDGPPTIRLRPTALDTDLRTFRINHIFTGTRLPLD